MDTFGDPAENAAHRRGLLDGAPSRVEQSEAERLRAENERLRGEIRYALESLRPDTVKGVFARQAIESLRRVAGIERLD